MGRIPMPPMQVAVKKRSKAICVPYEGLYVVFNDPGFFGPLENGLFVPDLPTGYFGKNAVIGPFQPKVDPTVVDVGFLDTVTGKIYAETVTVSSDCKKGARSKPRKKR